jgi:hypothetical protein
MAGRPAGPPGSAVGQKKYAGSLAEDVWCRLDTMDFINRGMVFAATLLLCLFPFLIVVSALVGHRRRSYPRGGRRPRLARALTRHERDRPVTPRPAVLSCHRMRVSRGRRTPYAVSSIQGRSAVLLHRPELNGLSPRCLPVS